MHGRLSARIGALLLGPALSACGPQTDQIVPGGVVSPTPCRDDDGDSFCLFQDCNDHDALIHPGAQERCNGLDENCDGIPDNRFADPDTTSATEPLEGTPGPIYNELVHLMGISENDASTPSPLKCMGFLVPDWDYLAESRDEARVALQCMNAKYPDVAPPYGFFADSCVHSRTEYPDVEHGGPGEFFVDVVLARVGGYIEGTSIPRYTLPPLDEMRGTCARDINHVQPGDVLFNPDNGGYIGIAFDLATDDTHGYDVIDSNSYSYSPGLIMQHPLTPAEVSEMYIWTNRSTFTCP